MLNSKGSFQTWAVVTLGQLSPWGSCPTWAVVLPGQLSNLGSCLTWAVVYLGSCCLVSCLPGQLSPGQLSYTARGAALSVEPAFDLKYLCTKIILLTQNIV